MIESVPASAPVVPPLTGASIMSMPFFASSAATLRTMLGALVERST